MEGIIKDGAPTPEIWTREAFPALGQGDVNAEGIIETLIGQDFDGWLVVEQDIMPQTSERFAQAINDQRENRAYLTAHGL